MVAAKHGRGGALDWWKVPVDTPVIVSYGRYRKRRAHFARITDAGYLYVWADGKTRWTANGSTERINKGGLLEPVGPINPAKRQHYVSKRKSSPT